MYHRNGDQLLSLAPELIRLLLYCSLFLAVFLLKGHNSIDTFPFNSPEMILVVSASSLEQSLLL